MIPLETRLFNILQRYDHFIESVQTKGNLYLVLNTFIFGGAITVLTSPQANAFSMALKNIIIFIIVVCVVSIIITLLALNPFLKSGRPGSLIFFQSVSAINYEDYRNEMKTISDEDYIKDLACQVHSMAKGLTKKYRLLTFVSWGLIINFLAILLWIYTYKVTQ
jgi:glucan phosphoethanolaminetransferase (alkaline phosphatase superfamily)